MCSGAKSSLRSNFPLAVSGLVFLPLKLVNLLNTLLKSGFVAEELTREIQGGTVAVKQHRVSSLLQFSL